MAEPVHEGVERPRDPAVEGPQPGWPQVLLIAIAIVAIVLTIAALSNLVPGLADAFGSFPILIVVLIGGTVAVVWRILRAPTTPG